MARGPARMRMAVTVAALVTVSLSACQAGAAVSGHSPATSRPPGPPAPLPAGNPPGPWHLIFQDGFNAASLDTAHWSTGWLSGGITVPVQPAELECYDPAQVTLAGGALELTLISKPESCGGQTRPYASGMVNTQGKLFFSFGFLEARIWLPGGRRIANWPAFWAVGQHWPKDGEIDVLEGLQGRACWHFINQAKKRGNCTQARVAGGWHTYGADWEPGSITYYYDGQVMGTIRSGITSAPMYLVLNNATEPRIGGHVLAPATMRVDYVRVWQHGP
ncbi:MAG TPA: glycoside hydrolase family 16 protein [Streptosporangiaceae bacterium]